MAKTINSNSYSPKVKKGGNRSYKLRNKRKSYKEYRGQGR